MIQFILDEIPFVFLEGSALRGNLSANSPRTIVIIPATLDTLRVCTPIHAYAGVNMYLYIVHTTRSTKSQGTWFGCDTYVCIYTYIYIYV